MPRKGMRSLCFHNPRSLSVSGNDSPSTSSSSSSSLTRALERCISAAEPLIAKWNPETSAYSSVTSMFYEDRREALELIRYINDLQRNMHLFVATHSSSESLIIRGQSLMQIAMKRLQKELYQILSTNRTHLDPESVSVQSSTRASARSSTSDTDGYGSTQEDEVIGVGNSINQVEQASMLAMDNLRLIAECMISCGYGKECHRIYTIIRKSIIDEGVYKLGVQKLSINQVNKMDWDVQDMKIKNWLEALKIAIRMLFTGEKILCDHVFASSESMRESVFSEISREGALIIFSFPEMISSSKKSSPEKMFRLLDMYTAIYQNWMEIETIFSSESTLPVQTQVLDSVTKLGELIRIMFSNFESVLHKADSSKSPVAGGGIHNLTNYVMNYLANLADYNNVLSDIILEPPVKFDLPESYFESSDSDDSQSTPAITVHVAWITLKLLCMLDGRSKHYKNNVSLSYLFLANNLQFIVTKIRRSNLKFILGEDWIAKHEVKISQFAANYERIGWSHVYASLPANPTVMMSSEEAKKCFKQFNSSFEDARKRQMSYIVTDAKLRDEIRVSIAGKILPAYRQMYNSRWSSLGEINVRSFVRFTPEDVGNCLSDLFYGKGESVSVSSASPSRSNRLFSFAK